MMNVKILLVEDNDADAELVVETFDAQKVRVDIERARDGVEALDLLRTGDDGAPMHVDLVLLDLNLPRMDGRQFLEIVKADDALRPIPVVVLTSSEYPDDISRSYELQAACYVAKPVDVAGLRQIVRAIDEFWLALVRFPGEQDA